jgi:hypothetical protein
MLRELVNDGFVLSRADHYSFGFAGAQLCTRFGRKLGNQGFSSLFDAGSRREAEEVVTFVEDETIPAVAGITAMGSNGTRSQLELLLVPFASGTPASINVAGVLLAFEISADVLGELVLSSWRYIHPPLQVCASRAVRKHSIADGLMVYNGTASL